MSSFTQTAIGPPTCIIEPVSSELSDPTVKRRSGFDVPIPTFPATYESVEVEARLPELSVYNIVFAIPPAIVLPAEIVADPQVTTWIFPLVAADKHPPAAKLDTYTFPVASTLNLDDPPTSRLNKSPVNVDVAFNAN